MAGTVCSKCNVGWEIHSHERYCGYCGCRVFDFAVRWEEEPLLYIGDSTDTHELTILVDNSGACPIMFQPIQTKQEKAVQFSEKYKQPFQVKAGQSRSIEIQVNSANLALSPETINVRAQEALPNLEGTKSLTLRALPRPDFKLTPRPAVVRYLKDTEKVVVDLHVEVLQSQFSIDAIKFSSGWISRVGVSRERHEKEGGKKSVRLEIDCGKLSDGLHSATLNFELRGFSQPIEQQIRIQAEVLPEPPRLLMSHANWEIIQDRSKSYTLTLQNKGECPLTVKGITISDPPDLARLLNVDFPINIEGGEHQNVEVLVSAEDIEPETYPINLTVLSNCETNPQYQGILNVTVKQREEYPHYLAIDFGTTNSCCAYTDLADYKLELIEIDGKANPLDIIPSSIVYHSCPINGKRYHVGYDAETYRTSEIDGPYYITSVKRWLGYEWKRPFPNNLKLQPRDVVSDILKHIINQAEAHLDTLSTKSKITRCVVTHPTMFSRKQQEDLRLAYKEIGITDLILIDEASAASIGTIFQRMEETPPDDYRLLVYDFGGGTIDIVLSQVTRNGNETKIEPLVRGGNPRYGGDDVTQAIVDFILRELKQRIQTGHPGLSVDVPYLKLKEIPKPAAHPEIDKAARYNTHHLYSQAEKMKRELSENSETTGTFTGLECVVGNDLRPVESLPPGNIDIKISEEQLQSLIGTELKKTFDDIDAMIADNGAQLPDVVILAGQSSKMPLVKKMMRTHFKEQYGIDIDIHLGERSKACVVMGAAQYALNYSLPATEGGGIKAVDLANKTYSRLGIVRRSGIKPIFDEIIPREQLIPKAKIVDFPLLGPTVTIDVREHFGTDNDLGKAESIGNYTLALPPDVPATELRKARLKMEVKIDGDIELTVLVNDAEYQSTVQKKKPAFVDGI